MTDTVVQEFISILKIVSIAEQVFHRLIIVHVYILWTLANDVVPDESPQKAASHLGVS